MEYALNEYRGKDFGFPDRDTDPAYKNTAEYALAYAKSIYSLFVDGKTAFAPGTYDYWGMLNRYAEGRQDTEKYKDWLLSNLTDDQGNSLSSYDNLADTPIGKKAKREGWYDIIWNVVSPAPVIMDKIIGTLTDVSFDLSVNVTDEKSLDKQETMKWEKITAGAYAEWFKYMIDTYGIPQEALSEDISSLPKSEEEFNYMAAKEGFKLNTAKAIEKLLRHSIDTTSKWEDVIIKKIIWDFVVKKVGAVEEYYDPETKSFKVRYIDISNVVIQYSKEDDFNDSEYAGYFTTMSISELMQRLPGVPEKEWRNLASKYVGKFSNPSVVSEDVATKAGSSGGYSNFRVPVFNTYWVDYDVRRSLRYKSVYGRETYKRIGYDTKIKPLSDKQISRGAEQEIISKRFRVVRSASWVVGTDYVFDYGVLNMAPRDENSKPIIPIHVEAIRGKSIIENIYPILDQFVLAFYRYQNTLAKMIERGYAVNIGMLLNISDGSGKKWPWTKVLRMWQQTGLLPFMVSFGGDYRGGDVTPVRPIDGGLGNRLNETIQIFNWCYDMILKLTGIDLLNPREGVSSDAPVDTPSEALTPLETTLKPIVYGMMELKRNAAYGVLRRIQLALRSSDEIRKRYIGIISEQDLKALVAAERDFAGYGISVVQRPDKKYRERLRAYIEKALEIGRNGMPGLTIDQAMFFEEQLDAGVNLIELRQRISYQIAKNRKEFKEESMRVVQAQTQGALQQKQAEMQAKAELAKYESQLRVQENSMQNKEYGDNERMKYNYQFINNLLELAGKEKKKEGVSL